ncbi:hypothetical protein EV421DRAFT_1908443 [Armillaria borealis]|uniref:Uncharacterized protein n=1 Tax=Armillaria borealis TaxID=47425 RepID=A0AA39J7M1_9AGAR|nr:hypothetical protein EV421DRAFT_1908443 [Armillaria borealis]
MIEAAGRSRTVQSTLDGSPSPGSQTSSYGNFKVTPVTTTASLKVGRTFSDNFRLAVHDRLWSAVSPALPTQMLVFADVDGGGLVCGKAGAKKLRFISVLVVLFDRQSLAWNHDMVHPTMSKSCGFHNSQVQDRDLLDLTAAATRDKNSAQPDIHQTWIDIEYAGASDSSSQSEYLPKPWYDVIGVIVQPSRPSLLPYGCTSSTGESTAEAPSVMTQPQADSLLTSV